MAGYLLFNNNSLFFCQKWRLNQVRNQAKQEEYEEKNKVQKLSLLKFLHIHCFDTSTIYGNPQVIYGSDIEIIMVISCTAIRVTKNDVFDKEKKSLLHIKNNFIFTTFKEEQHTV